METIVISLGGSIVSKEDGVNVDFIKKFVATLQKHRKKKFVVVVGGGWINKQTLVYAKQVTDNQYLLDEMGLHLTRLNAMIVKSALDRSDEVYKEVITDYHELRKTMSLSSKRVAFMGGVLPGFSTDGVATLAAESVGAKLLINVSNTAYVYDRDPKEKGAKKFERLGYNQFIELANKFDQRTPKNSFVFDIIGAKLARRAGIKIMFTNDDIGNLELAITGKPHKGTVVTD